MNSNDFYCDFVLNNKIHVKKEIETKNILAFYHTKPSWSFHIVIVPKKHITDLEKLRSYKLIEEIFAVATKIIKKYRLSDKNYKIIVNGGKFQDSKHLHFHLVSGEKIK